MTMEQIFNKIKQDRGDAVFGSGERLLGLFADYTKGKMKPQQNQLDIFLKCDGNTCIMNLRDATGPKRQTEYHRLIQKMVGEYGMQREIAGEVCGAFWKVTVGTEPPTIESVPSSSPSTGCIPDNTSSASHDAAEKSNSVLEKLRRKPLSQAAKETARKKPARRYRNSWDPRSPVEKWRDRILMIWMFFSFVPALCMLGFIDTGFPFGLFALLIILDPFVTILREGKVKAFIPILEIVFFLGVLPYVFSKISVPKDSLDYPLIRCIMILVAVWAVLTVLVHVFLANFEKVKTYIERKEDEE